MALSESEAKRIRETLRDRSPTGHAAAYCVDHLAARAGLPPDKLEDLRAFVRALRTDPAYFVSEPGVCDVGAHSVTDLVIRARASGPPTIDSPSR